MRPLINKIEAFVFLKFNCNWSQVSKSWMRCFPQKISQLLLTWSYEFLFHMPLQTHFQSAYIQLQWYCQKHKVRMKGKFKYIYPLYKPHANDLKSCNRNMIEEKRELWMCTCRAMTPAVNCVIGWAVTGNAFITSNTWPGGKYTMINLNVVC